MFNDEFKERYTTIPFAVAATDASFVSREVITHQHGEIEIISVERGSADFYVDSRPFHIKSGDVLIIPPYALHRGLTSSEEHTVYSCICFDTSLLCDTELENSIKSGKCSIGGVISEALSYTARIREQIKAAVSACENKELGWELEAVGNMSLIFSTLKKNTAATDTSEKSREANFGKLAMTYIIENYKTDATSKTASEALHMNHSYFCRIFKRTFGCCFANYVLAYRLEKAQIYLRRTSLPVTEIAFSVGFNNCSYFGKAFKERFGTSPLSYRKAKC